MTIPMVTQFRFTRSELVRCVEGVSPEEAIMRFEPMNCISWIVGHLASQEQYMWVYLSEGKIIAPNLHKLVGYGSPASTPPLDEMLALWKEITATADEFLDNMTPAMLNQCPTSVQRPNPEDYGTMLLRNIYHYWFHIGEAYAIRQMLGHANLPEFVGDMDSVVCI